MKNSDATVKRSGSPPVDPDATVLRPQGRSPTQTATAAAPRRAAEAPSTLSPESEFPATTTFDPREALERDPTTIVTPRVAPRPSVAGRDPTTVVLPRGGDDADTTVLRPGQATLREGDRTLQRGAAPGLLPKRKLGLPNGLRVLEYRIERVLGQGGFGITYLATDANLDAKVAIKEYLPEEIAFRASDHSVSPNASQHRDRYQQGLENFLVEARTLASFRHPNIVRVARFFEAHHTAYMVLEYERGKSFKKWWLAQRQHGERLLVERLQPLLDGLSVVHAAGYLHRDIKPDNIQVRSEDGRFVLLDFGSAGQTVALADQDAVVVTPGYAPIEQYGVGEQGAWTDIYALGATLYWAVAGKKPPDAEARAGGATLAPAVEVGRGRFGPAFLAAVDWALQSDPDARPRNVDAWRDRLLAEHVASLGLKQALRHNDSILDAEIGASMRERWLQRLRGAGRRLFTPNAWPLAGKLALLLLASGLLPMLATALVHLHGAQAALSDGQLRKTELIAHHTAGRLAQLLGDSTRLTRALAADAELARWLARPDPATQETLRLRLAAVTDTNPDLESVLLLDALGTARIATDPALVGRSFASRGEHAAAAVGRSYASRLGPESAADAAGVSMAEPVRDGAGQVSGAVVLRVRAVAVGAILDGVRHDAELTPFLLDGDGVVMHHPRQELLNRSLDEPTLAAAMRAARQGGAVAYRSSLSGGDEIVGFAPVPGQAWVVGVSVPQAAVDQPLQPLRALLPWSLVLLGLVLLALALRCARSVVRPVQALTAGAQALKSGDFERAYVDVKGRDEVGQLARTFNVTVDVLRQRERERESRRRS